MSLFKYVNVTFMIDSKISSKELEELLKSYFDGEKEYQTDKGNWVVPVVNKVEDSIGE